MTTGEVQQLRHAVEQIRHDVAKNREQLADFESERRKRDKTLDDRWTNIKWGLGITVPVLAVAVIAVVGWLWNFTSGHGARVSVVETRIETVEDTVKDGFNALRGDLRDIRTDIRADRQRNDARRPQR